MSPIKFNSIALCLASLLISGCGDDNDNQMSQNSSSITKENKGTKNLDVEEQIRKKVGMTYIVYWKESLVENGSRVEALKNATKLNIESVKNRKNIDAIIVKDNLSPYEIKKKIDNSGMVKQVVQEQLIKTQ